MKSKLTIYFCILSILSSSISLAKADNIDVKNEAQKTNNVSSKDKKTKYYRNMFEIGAGISYGYSSYEYDEPSGYKIANNISLKESSVLYNLNARYKIYLNKYKKSSMFLVPEFFYSFGSFKPTDVFRGIDFGSNTVVSADVNFEIKPEYGFKLSLGYEIDNKNSLSVGAGAQKGSYKYSISNNGVGISESGDYWAPFIGIDYQYNIIKYVFVGASLQYYFANIGLDESGIELRDRFNTKNVDKMSGSYFTLGLNVGVRF